MENPAPTSASTDPELASGLASDTPDGPEDEAVDPFSLDSLARQEIATALRTTVCLPVETV